MSTRTIEWEFIMLNVPTHLDIGESSRDGEERILSLSKNIAPWNGSLTITVKRYRWSQAPARATKKLFEYLHPFAEDYVKQRIGTIKTPAYDLVSSGEGRIKMVAASFGARDDVAELGIFLRIWLISDGRHFVYAIYRLGDLGETFKSKNQDLKDCEAIVASIRFRK